MISTKPPKCKHCKARLDRPGMKLHDACVDPWLAANRQKIAAKVKARQAEAAGALYTRHRGPRPVGAVIARPVTRPKTVTGLTICASRFPSPVSSCC